MVTYKAKVGSTVELSLAKVAMTPGASSCCGGGNCCCTSCW